MKPDITSSTTAPLWRRLAWFIGIWLASVAAVGSVAYVLRLLLRA